GRDPDSLSLGAYVNVVAHPDPEVARDLAAPGLFSFARFSAMHGHATGALDPDDRALVERIPGVYDMNRHFRRQAPQSELLTPEFARRFGAVGPPAECAARLAELVALGLDRLVVVGPSFDAEAGARADAEACFLSEVAPAVRAGA